MEREGFSAMRILITGATGFVGGYLAEALLAQRPDAELHGTGLTDSWPSFAIHLSGQVTLHAGDLTDANHVESVLRAARPEQIYHLAGYASSGQSFREAEAAWAGNLTVTRMLLEAAAEQRQRPRILHVSTALIYASPDPADRPIDENAPLDCKSPYAESKEAADQLAGQFALESGLDIVRVRPFNHIGPRQSPQFAVASFAQQLARIELGLASPRIETGDLTARRDFTDVRDMVAAYVALMKHGVRGEVYNAGSGAAVSMAEVLDLLRGECPVPVEVVTASERLRPADVSVLVADFSKLRAATGWLPRIPLQQTLRDTLDFWRAQEETNR